MKHVIQYIGTVLVLGVLLMAIGGMLTWLGVKEYQVGFITGVVIVYASIYLAKTLQK